MIDTLEKLVEFTQRRGASMPEFRDEVVVGFPGCSQEEIARLVNSLPGLPAEYLATIRCIDVHGISLGSFGLGPGLSRAGTLVDSLIEANDPNVCPFAEYCRRDGCYWVASWEADPVGMVLPGGHWPAGQLVLYNIADLEGGARRLAESYRQFLLLAATLQECEDAGRRVDDFLEQLQELANAASIESTWRMIAGTVLDGKGE